MFRILAFTLLLVGASVASADDIIKITYTTGFVAPGSGESTTIQVKSDGGDYPDRPKEELGIFFNDVRKILDSAHTPAKWEQVPPPDTGVVRVEITLGKRHHVLSTAFYGEPRIHIGAEADDRRQLEALKQILRLTTERLARTLGGVQPK